VRCRDTARAEDQFQCLPILHGTNNTGWEGRGGLGPGPLSIEEHLVLAGLSRLQARDVDEGVEMVPAPSYTTPERGATVRHASTSRTRAASESQEAREPSTVASRPDDALLREQQLARRLRPATREDDSLGSGRVGLPGSSDAGFHLSGSLPESRRKKMIHTGMYRFPSIV
jgi:hypothetical protein